MALILDGKKAREERAKILKEKVKGLSKEPVLAILQVGEKPESAAYIEQKKKFSEEVGAGVIHKTFPREISEEDLVSEINNLNTDDGVQGIIVQLPVPKHLDRRKVIDAISPEKDVDGLSSENARMLAEGRPRLVPATARGILELLTFYEIGISGKKAAVLGRSSLVGKPTAELLKLKGAQVISCDSDTKDTKEITRQSDIIVVAIGKPRLIGAEYFRNDKSQVVVNVGITAVTEKGEERLEEEIPISPQVRDKRKLLGDVDFENVKDTVAAISPVPGGVGPMTVLALFENLLDAC